MWNEFFDTIRYINLDRRQDRRLECESELLRVGIKAERFQAYEGNNKALGFNKSQWNVLNESKDAKSILILEDDIVFTNLDHLPEALEELPEDWDVLYLGANINGTKLERYSRHLFKIRNSYTTHAVAYSSKMAKWIVENFPFYTDDYEKEGLTIYDEWLRVNVQEQFKSFLIYPMVAEQRISFSDIWSCEANYTSCFKQGNELLSRI
jgi:GR25 family glycosyltransferase involved in LPS biosynthesis